MSEEKKLIRHSTASTMFLRLSLTRGLISAAAVSIAIMWGYAAYYFTRSSFLTSLVDSVYTMAFAITAMLIARVPHLPSAQISITAGSLISAATVATIAMLAPLHEYQSLMILAITVGAITGINYPAWYSLLRQISSESRLRSRIGLYEALRVAAVLGGSIGTGLAARYLGLETTSLLIAGLFGFAGILLITRSLPVSSTQPKTGERAILDHQVRCRLRILLAMFGVIQFLVTPIVAVVPVLAIGTLDGSPILLGALTALYSAGGMLQFIPTYLIDKGRRKRVISIATWGFMLVGTCGAIFWENQFGAGLLMFSFGFGISTIGTLINAEIQLSVPEAARDRYLARYAVLMALPLSIGCLVWGTAAEFFPVATIALAAIIGTGSILGGCLFKLIQLN